MREVDVRRALNQEIPRLFPDEEGVVVIDEFGICQGQARVDIALINGSIHGFEIKSDSDTLERLPSQQKVYNSVLETMTIVSAEKHLKNIKEIVPLWWGIMIVKEADGKVSIEEIRKGGKNPSIDPLSLVQLLWHDEALSLLEDYDLADGLRCKPRKYIWSALAQNIPLDKLVDHIREILKNRDSLKKRNNWKAD